MLVAVAAVALVVIAVMVVVPAAVVVSLAIGVPVLVIVLAPIAVAPAVVAATVVLIGEGGCGSERRRGERDDREHGEESSAVDHVTLLTWIVAIVTRVAEGALSVP